MQLAILACVAVAFTAHTCFGGSEPGWGEWTSCRKSLEDALKTIRPFIEDLENKTTKEIVLSGDECSPCEQIRVKGLSSIDLMENKDPASRPCKEGDEDCFVQKMPVCIKQFSFKCAYSNELTFLIKLLAFGGKELTNALCLIPGANLLPPCVAGEAGKAVGTVIDKASEVTKKIPIIGKRAASLVKRGGDSDEPKNFWLEVSGETGNIDMLTILDWNTEKTEIEDVTFTQDSLLDTKFTIEGDTLVGVLGKLLTDTLYLGKILGLLMKLLLMIVLPPIIKGNKDFRDNISAANCGN